MQKSATKYAQSLIPYTQNILNFHNSKQIHFCYQTCWKKFPLNYSGLASLCICIKCQQGEGAGATRNAHGYDPVGQLVSLGLKLDRAVRFSFQSDKGKNILEMHGHEKQSIHVWVSMHAMQVIF